ncbi:hypothetical protein WJX81_006555 [Elliptochloris bilobata]|uniref:Nucleolar protein 12 n=1 Tax=Elliptochloris bilobata TaxID=381761 RepID=A0AAW1RMW1_9CHLO
MKQAWGGTYSEGNALSFSELVPGDAVPTAHHVDKRRQKRKGLEVVFDPAAHKDFVTGFHKRKLQRRKEAQEKLEEKARKQRLEDRAKRREELRERLHLDRYGTPPVSEDDAPASGAPAPRRVLEYAAGDLHTTVTVAPISMYSDEEPSSSGSDKEEAHAGGAAAAAPQKHFPSPGAACRSASASAAFGPGRPHGGKKRPAGTFSRLVEPRGATQAGGAAGRRNKGTKGKKRRT